ncbi:MAG TPA: glycoside hydrolase family 31 protein [Bacteroidia bacterium]|nr:glycoside hydrolase family 31 protein [Bacteroidia bacterium]
MKNLYFSVCLALFFACFIHVSTAQPLQNDWNDNSSAQFTMDTVDDYGFEWPAWIFSHWVWEDEGNRESALQLIDSYLAHGIPVGAAIIDSPWETGYNTFVVDTALYPDPQSMIDHYHSKNVKILLWITGVINNDVQPLYDSIAALNYFMKANAAY